MSGGSLNWLMTCNSLCLKVVNFCDGSGAIESDTHAVFCCSFSDTHAATFRVLWLFQCTSLLMTGDSLNRLMNCISLCLKIVSFCDDSGTIDIDRLVNKEDFLIMVFLVVDEGVNLVWLLYNMVLTVELLGVSIKAHLQWNEPDSQIKKADWQVKRAGCF